MKELQAIQQKLVAPKGQKNEFAHFNFRSAEDILASVKPLLKEENCTLLLTDEIKLIGDRYYVEATVTLINEAGEKEFTKASAREQEVKKGMDASQITGASSSYARKYAMNGLFSIDNTPDADTMNNSISKKEAFESSMRKLKKEYEKNGLEKEWEDDFSDYKECPTKNFRQFYNLAKNELQELLKGVK